MKTTFLSFALLGISAVGVGTAGDPTPGGKPHADPRGDLSGGPMPPRVKEPGAPVETSKPAEAPLPALACDLIAPGHILIPAKIGDEQGWLLVDNGAPLTLLHPALLPKEAGAAREIAAEIGGKAASIPFDPNPGRRFLLKMLRDQYPDLRILGLLGHDFLSRYDIRFDFPRRKASFYAPETLKLPKPESLGPEHVLLTGVQDAGGHLFLDDCAVGEKLKGRIHLDLGSPDFNFDAELAKKAGIEGEVIPEFRVGTMAFQGFSWSGRNFREVFPQANLVGEIGVRELRNAVLTLHNSRARIEIERDPSVMPHRLLLGITLADGNEVSEAPAGSRGEALGLKKGDRILSMNGVATPSATFLRDASSRKPRKGPHRLVVLRDGKELALEGTPQ